jgi:hypothetical protein
MKPEDYILTHEYQIPKLSAVLIPTCVYPRNIFSFVLHFRHDLHSLES